MKIKYYTVHFQNDLKYVLKQLDGEFGLENLYPVERPTSLMGSAKILVLQDFRRGDVRIKIDGPGFLVFDIFNKLMDNYKSKEEEE